MAEEFVSAFDRSSLYRRLSLRFSPPSLEAEYLWQRSEEKADLVVYTFSLGLALYFLLMIVDYDRLLYRLPAGGIALLVAGALPNAIPPLGARFFPGLRRSLHILVPVILGLNTLIHVAAILSAPIVGLEFPPLLLTIQLSFLLLLSGVLLRHAVPLATLAVVLYVLADWRTGMRGDILAESAFALIANLLLGSIACRALEKSERIAWLHARRFLEQAEHDQLTGIHNRRFLDQRGQQLLRQGLRERKQVSALFVDLDHFKSYNDTLGHLQGDQALRLVAVTLAGQARRPLDIACRAGGEEFALVLYDCDSEAARIRAEQLRQSVEALQIPHPKSPLGKVTVSIGVACTSTSGFSLQALIDAADRALYVAKRRGRNQVSLGSVPATDASKPLEATQAGD